ncbi:MAG: HDIG domain-containing protein [Anaerolineae bacterium]|nr:HDIG domain-containing protein [Anaerolineae bacterium]RIK20250.1 MAG: HAD family hydrolase [Anaerolineae bacterium]
MKTRDDAWEMVCRYVQEPGLRRHMLAVSVAMADYAGRLGEDVDYWATVGLLHDFDWEIHPNLDEHPGKGAGILRADGWDEETIRVILSHYTEGTGVKREKPIDYALLACDEITGLIIATTLVKSSRNIADVSLDSVRKKWKDRRFAAGVNRDEVVAITEDFSRECFNGDLELWAHVENVLNAMKGSAAELGLNGSDGVS